MFLSRTDQLTSKKFLSLPIEYSSFVFKKSLLLCKKSFSIKIVNSLSVLSCKVVFFCNGWKVNKSIQLLVSLTFSSYIGNFSIDKLQIYLCTYEGFDSEGTPLHQVQYFKFESGLFYSRSPVQISSCPSVIGTTKERIQLWFLRSKGSF